MKIREELTSQLDAHLRVCRRPAVPLMAAHGTGFPVVPAVRSRPASSSALRVSAAAVTPQSAGGPVEMTMPTSSARSSPAASIVAPVAAPGGGGGRPPTTTGSYPIAASPPPSGAPVLLQPQQFIIYNPEANGLVALGQNDFSGSGIKVVIIGGGGIDGMPNFNASFIQELQAMNASYMSAVPAEGQSALDNCNSIPSHVIEPMDEEKEGEECEDSDDSYNDEDDVEDDMNTSSMLPSSQTSVPLVKVDPETRNESNSDGRLQHTVVPLSVVKSTASGPLAPATTIATTASLTTLVVRPRDSNQNGISTAVDAARQGVDMPRGTGARRYRSSKSRTNGDDVMARASDNQPFLPCLPLMVADINDEAEL